MIYFDTSYIAKCYLNEPHADKVRQLAMRSDGLACWEKTYCLPARIESCLNDCDQRIPR